MNRQAVVGLFTILGLVGLFAVFLELANVGTQGRYRIGVHFKSASGLHKGALVYESGVVVGVVDSTELLADDFTVDVILAINNNVDVPRSARFIIQAPLTGDSTVEIVPAAAPPGGYPAPQASPKAVAVLPHEVLPLSQQPQGTNPATVQDLLDQGQGEIRRLDAMLAQLERSEPVLLGQVQSLLKNGNELTGTANQSFQKLSRRIDTLGDTLQLAIQQGSANLTDVSAQLDATVRRNTGHFDAMIAALDNSARDLNATADQIKSLAGDPRLKDNILQTTQGIAQTAQQFAAITSDLHDVTGNPQTKAQLRDTVANIDAASQKANSLFAQFGGRSSVYGIDPGATPAPVPSGSPHPGSVPPGVTPPGTESPRRGPSPAPGTIQANVKNKVGTLVHQLIALQIRVSELDAQHVSTGNTSPLLTSDRGPSTDINLIALPYGRTYLFTGVNDLGGPSSTWNFAAMERVAPGLQLGGGVLYSQLGARALYTPGRTGRGFGVEGLLYDPRHPTLDTYANYRLGGGLSLFGGERDLTHPDRRTVFGFQYNF
jgi:ABC-type transporter Mla subunit MlaD